MGRAGGRRWRTALRVAFACESRKTAYQITLRYHCVANEVIAAGI